MNTQEYLPEPREFPISVRLFIDDGEAVFFYFMPKDDVYMHHWIRVLIRGSM